MELSTEGNMEAETKTMAQPPLPLEEPASGIFEAYSNAVDADWTLTDVTLRFLQLVHAPKEDGATTSNRELIVLERANITMPWLQAKVLAATLGNLIQSYESVNGELKMPTLAPSPQPPQPQTES
jgi:hypothetical protein